MEPHSDLKKYKISCSATLDYIFICLSRSHLLFPTISVAEQSHTATLELPRSALVASQSRVSPTFLSPEFPQPFPFASAPMASLSTGYLLPDIPNLVICRVKAVLCSTQLEIVTCIPSVMTPPSSPIDPEG